MPRTPLPDEALLRGLHRIRRVLGQGGFGITYLARNELLEVDVAVKEYFPLGFADRMQDGTVRPRDDQRDSFSWGKSRFAEEARVLARLDHPNIAAVTEFFEENGTAYIVLRYEAGDSLRRWASRLGRPPTQTELDRIVHALLSALEFMHDQRVLHRDIAPDNIMMRADGSPVLIDFGSARRLVDARSQGMTAIVKSGYSPPESYVSSPGVAGPWTDIYALAATLYHVIGGSAPQEAIKRQLGDELRPLALIAPSGYRRAFLAAIDRGLALRPADRPQSIAAWRPGLLPPPDLPPGVIPGAVEPARAAAAAGPTAPKVADRVAVAPTRMIDVAPPPGRPASSPGPAPIPEAARSPAPAVGAALVRHPAEACDYQSPAASPPPRPRARWPDDLRPLLSNPFDWAVLAVSLLGLAGLLAAGIGSIAHRGTPTLLEHRVVRISVLVMLLPTLLSLVVYNVGYLAAGGGDPDQVRSAGRRIAARNVSLLGQISMLFIVTAPLVALWLCLAAVARRARAAVPIVLGLPLQAGLLTAGTAYLVKVPFAPSGVPGVESLDLWIYWAVGLFPVIAGALGLLSSVAFAVRRAAARA